MRAPRLLANALQLITVALYCFLVPSPTSGAADYCTTSASLQILNDTAFTNPSAVPYALATPSFPDCHALCCSVAGCLSFTLSHKPGSSGRYQCLLHQSLEPTHPSPNSTSAILHLPPNPSTALRDDVTIPSRRLLSPRLLPSAPWNATECHSGCQLTPGCIAAEGTRLSPSLFHCRAVGFFTSLTADPSTTTFLIAPAVVQPTPLPYDYSTQTVSAPIRGWNTYDSYGSVPSEAEILLNAQSVSKYLRASGYRVISLDWGWWLSLGGANTLDVFGRFQPSADRFPSSAGGKGFRGLSEQLHSMGLLLGIYTNAGFSIYFNNTGPHHIPNLTQCVWAGNNYFLDWQDPDAQAWLDGTVQQWAEWGVDYVKIDCIASITGYQQALMYSTAIARSSNPDMILSISPGWNGDLASERTIAPYVNQYRLQVDFKDLWDKPVSFYPAVPQQVDFASRMEGLYAGLPMLDSARAGGRGQLRLSFGDLDILPFGWIFSMSKGGSKATWSFFNHSMQQTVFSIWCFYRSPLLYGGNLREENIDHASLAVVTNAALLHIHEAGYDTSTLFVNHTWLSIWGGRPDLKEVWVLKANINDTAVYEETMTMGDMRCDWKEAWTGRVESGVATVTIRVAYSEVNVWTVTGCEQNGEDAMDGLFGRKGQWPAVMRAATEQHFVRMEQAMRAVRRD